MIFYFTGTGNSQFAAESLLQPGERLISIKEAVWDKKYTYELEPGEKLGFVTPVYCSGLPTIVRHFFGKLRISGASRNAETDAAAPEYVYGVLTYGMYAGGADAMLRRELSRSGIAVDKVYRVHMPENFFPIFPMLSEEKEEKLLEEAGRQLDRIREDIGKNGGLHPDLGYRSPAPVGVLSRGVHELYRLPLVRSTKKFWVDDECVGCHACEERCPSKAIRLVDGKPVWIKKSCVMCMGCARCGAIHYGKADQKHGRYKHPIFRKH